MLRRRQYDLPIFIDPDAGEDEGSSDEGSDEEEWEEAEGEGESTL
jgi:hypothetical protein